MNITLRMNAKDIIDKMYLDATEDELFDFIKSLDLRVGDYNFTNRLKNYFVSEIQKEDAIDEENEKEDALKQ